MASGPARLLGDIGATNARFALLYPDGSVQAERNIAVASHERFRDAIDAYLMPLPSADRPREAAFAIAAPIVGDTIAMLNAPWRFAQSVLKREFGWSALHVVNDFAANALSVPYLDPAHLTQIGKGNSVPGQTIAVLGPGTGLGVAGLVPAKEGWIAVAGEGGHATLAAFDSREEAIIDVLRRQYAHVSAERALSGPGLVNLYDALCELAGRPQSSVSPEHVTNLYPGCDPQAREAVMTFCAMLGTFTGSVTLTYGARGGVYIMGGVIPKIIEFFRNSAFRERFEFKGRYRHYLEAIPTYVVMQPVPAFLGLKTLFRETVE